MTKVFITRRLPSVASELLREHFEVDQGTQGDLYTPAQLTRLTTEFDAILSTVLERFDAAVLSGPMRLKALSNYAAGSDNIDRDAARARGVSVYCTPDIVTNSTADLTFALLLALVRQLPAAQRFVRANEWKRWDPELFLGDELHGKTLGILGFGKIGQAVARRALGFGLKVIYHSRGGTPVAPDLSAQVRAVGLSELLAKSDYLTIHVPLTAETRGMINAATFAKMRRDALVVNMARGDVIVTDDLLRALDSGAIRGCALDVTSPEPLPGDHPLCKMENVIVLPHIGTATVECRANMARAAAESIVSHFGQ